MKKLILGMIMVILLVACGDNKKEEKIQIGITQIVEHPSLDAIRQGVEDALNDSDYKEKVIFNYQNAQGDFAIAQTIASQFKEDSDIIVAITTPSAQAALNQIKDKPLFFTGVTNPKGAGLIGKNITGVSDMSPIEAQVELVKDLLPDTKKIGTIYNTSEANSVFLTEEFVKEANARGLEVVARGITNVTEMASAMDSLVDAVDVIYTTKDNTVASAYSLIVEKADEAGIPIIGATRDFTENGALASVGMSEYQVGYQTGKMIVRYLNGEKIEDMPTEYIKDTEIVINREKMEKYGVLIDNNKLNEIEIIN